jgi:hypothetical protein
MELKVYLGRDSMIRCLKKLPFLNLKTFIFVEEETESIYMLTDSLEELSGDGKIHLFLNENDVKLVYVKVNDTLVFRIVKKNDHWVIKHKDLNNKEVGRTEDLSYKVLRTHIDDLLSQYGFN